MKLISCFVALVLMVATPRPAAADSLAIGQALDFLESHRVRPTPDQKMVRWLERAGLGAVGTAASFFGWCAFYAFISGRPMPRTTARAVVMLSPLAAIPVAGFFFYAATIVSTVMAAPRAAIIAIAPFAFKEWLSLSKFLDLPRADQLNALADSPDQTRWILWLAEQLSSGQRIDESRVDELFRADGQP